MEARTEKRKKIIRWIPVVSWMGAIFFFSSRQSVTVSEEYMLNFLFFKTLHLLEYAILFLLSARATKVYARAFMVTALYAMTDELHQVFVPTREGRVRDVIIDATGAGLAWFYLSIFLPKAPQRLKNWAKGWDIPL